MSNDLVPSDDPLMNNYGGDSVTDLLPVLPASGGQPLVVKKTPGGNGGMKIPKLKLLQKMSNACDEIDGARAGLFLHEGSNTIISPPFRVLVVHMHTWNLLSPSENNSDHDGLEKCYSHDLENGSHYGLCKECGKCTSWRKGRDGKRNVPPLGKQFIDWTILTKFGPAVLQCSSRAYRVAKNFNDNAVMMGKNWWAHPTVLRGVAKTDGKNTNFVLGMDWDTMEDTDPQLQEMAYSMFQQQEEHWEESIRRFLNPSEEQKAESEFDV